MNRRARRGQGVCGRAVLIGTFRAFTAPVSPLSFPRFAPPPSLLVRVPFADHLLPAMPEANAPVPSTPAPVSDRSPLPLDRLEPAVPSPTGAPDQPAPAAAIIYVPSVGDTVDSDSVDGFARRVARSLDYGDDAPDVSYSMRAAAPASYGHSDSKAEVREILRTEPGQEPVVTHRVYHLGYHPLLEATKRSNALLQIFDLFYLCFVLALRFGVAVRRKSLGRAHKMTLFVGGACLAVILLYGIVTAGAVVHAAAPALTQNVRETYGNVKAKITAKLRAKFPEATAVVADYTRPIRDYAAHILVALGSLGLTLTAVRERLDRGGRSLMRFGRYLMIGEGRACCTGQFNALLEYIVTQKPTRIDVVGYSMGSLIALDAIFPGQGMKPSRASHITSLSTIGCPFDLVRTLWPRYFAHRTSTGPNVPWFNVYSPIDLLGSNFRNDTRTDDPPSHGINHPDPSGDSTPARETFRPKQSLAYDHANRTDVGLIDALLLRAFSAHAQYWVPDSYEAESCFTVLVPAIYHEDASTRAAVFVQS